MRHTATCGVAGRSWDAAAVVLPEAMVLHRCADRPPAGGELFTVMNGPDGERFDNRGVFRDVEPQKRRVTTDAFRPGWQPSLHDRRNPVRRRRRWQDALRRPGHALDRRSQERARANGLSRWGGGCRSAQSSGPNPVAESMPRYGPASGSTAIERGMRSFTFRCCWTAASRTCFAPDQSGPSQVVEFTFAGAAAPSNAPPSPTINSPPAIGQGRYEKLPRSMQSC